MSLLHVIFALFFAWPCVAASPVRELLSQNRLEKAKGLCRQFEVLATNDQDTNLACAWVYFRSGMNGPAEKLVEKARKSFSLPEYQLLLLYARFKNGKGDDALTGLDSIISMNRGTKVSYAAEEIKAEIYEEKGQLSSAALLYERILKESPNRGRAHWGLSRFYLAKGDTTKAIRHLEKTAALWPEHTASRFNLGVLYLSKENENLEHAQTWLVSAYKLNKADSEVLEQLGVLFEKQGRTPEAVKYWQKAVEVKADAPIANEKLGGYLVQIIDLLIDQKKYSEALKKIESSPKAMDQPSIVLRRGVIYRNLQKFEKAVVDLQRFILSNPKHAQALREVGICYLNLGSKDQAHSYFTRAITEEPNNGVNHAWMAFVLESKGDFIGARDSWKKATEMIKEPADLQRAVRRLASVEKRIQSRETKEDK